MNQARVSVSKQYYGDKAQPDSLRREAVFPPGLGEADFCSAIAKFIDALNPDAVMTADDNLDVYIDRFALPQDCRLKISAIVAPASTAQVQAVVKIANDYRIPLWIYMGGVHNGYGTTVPRVEGSVLVDLRRMNRVLEINEECAYAVVEPGVSYYELYEHLRTGGHKLMMSVPELGWVSVIGNTLEYGYGYTPHGDHALYQCGMEIVLANGDLLRTGMGGMSSGNTWHVYKKAFGPSIDGLFMQSNLGIVTRMGIWLMPKPQRYLSCVVQCRHDTDLPKLIDVARPFLLNRTIPNNPVIANLLSTIALIAPRHEWYQGEGPIPEDVLNRIVEETGLGRWTMRFALYGDHRLVEVQMGMLRDAFSAIPGAEINYREYEGDLAEDSIHPADKTQIGIPANDMIDTARWRSDQSGGYLSFSSVAPLVGAEVAAQSELIRAGLRDAGFDHHCSLVLFSRSAVHASPIVFDRNDRNQVAAAYTAYAALIESTGAAGYGPRRTHLNFMDMVENQFDFNDHALRRVNQALKDALDPNGVLAPGRYGIWPGTSE